jgi:hypothetical protein
MTSPIGDRRSVCAAQEMCPDHIVLFCFFPLCVFLIPGPPGKTSQGVTSGIPLCERLSPETFLDLRTEGGGMHGEGECSEG